VRVAVPAAPPPPVPTRTVEVETPEQVLLDFELADLGSRFLALVADGAVLATTVVGLVALAWGLSELFGGMPPWLEGWTSAVWILLLFVVVFGYFILFEGLADGRTPGKRWVGIRVMHDGGHPITFRGSAIRNLVRLVDLQPLVSGLVGGATMMVHPYTKRLGDLAAGTVVVRDRGRASLREALEAFEAPAERMTLPLEPRLDEERFVALERFVARRDELAPEARERLAGSLLERLDAAAVAAAADAAPDAVADAVPGGDPGARLAFQIVFGTIPVVAAGFFLLPMIVGPLRGIEVIAWATIGFGLLLLVADKMCMTIKAVNHLTYVEVLIIGCAQVLALIPGTSRSGITITAARLLGYERAEAARFSMLLSIPTIIAAGSLAGYELYEAGDAALTFDAVFAGALAFLTALIAIALMMAWLRRASFTPFVIYRLLLGTALLAVIYS